MYNATNRILIQNASHIIHSHSEPEVQLDDKRDHYRAIESLLIPSSQHTFDSGFSRDSNFCWK